MGSKYTYLIDPGHGGMVDGVYVTPGKRSPKFEDGFVLYEGVNNREMAKVLMNKMKERGIRYKDIIDTNNDVPLELRTRIANTMYTADKNLVLISIHSDAAGDGKEFHTASGISVYTSPGQTTSDKFAQLVIDELQAKLSGDIKFRTDISDKDEDKEAAFWMLTQTKMPSILCELGFHTNREEVLLMVTKEFKEAVADAIVEAIIKFEKQ